MVSLFEEKAEEATSGKAVDHDFDLPVCARLPERIEQPANPVRVVKVGVNRGITMEQSRNLPVRALVRELTDAELVVAQGIENSQRQDLSYIERALFATRLEDRGFERSIIMDALATDKGELSKLISVARSVPESIIEVIGPAPKAGRRRWIALADALRDSAVKRKVERATKDPDLLKADTDTRFLRVFAATKPSSEPQPSAVGWKSASGRAAVTKVASFSPVNPVRPATLKKSKQAGTRSANVLALRI